MSLQEGVVEVTPFIVSLANQRVGPNHPRGRFLEVGRLGLVVAKQQTRPVAILAAGSASTSLFRRRARDFLCSPFLVAPLAALFGKHGEKVSSGVSLFRVCRADLSSLSLECRPLPAPWGFTQGWPQTRVKELATTPTAYASRGRDDRAEAVSSRKSYLF